MAQNKGKFQNFYVEGECSDHGWLTANRDTFEAELFEEMLRKGALPVLDREVSYKWSYDQESGLCKFKATARCMKVGRKRAKGLQGILSNEGIVVEKDAEGVRPLASV